MIQREGTTKFEFLLLIQVGVAWTPLQTGSSHLAPKSFFIFSFFEMMTIGRRTVMIVGCIGQKKSSRLKFLVTFSGTDFMIIFKSQKIVIITSIPGR
jgi:hypothetical protein